MPAGIEDHDQMFSVREKPWHGLGVVLDEHPKTITEAIEKAGLDWQVEQRPVYVPVDDDSDKMEPVPGWAVNFRSDLKIPLGVVTSRYRPVQNREAFSFLSNIFGSEMHFETAGSLMNGRRVWVLMKIPQWVEVGGDAIGQYAFISNSHDGKSAVLAAMTPVRIVCQNTLNAAVNVAKGVKARRTYTIRHLGNPSEKIAEARQVMEVTINYYEQFKSIGDRMALTKIGDKRAKSYVEKLLPISQGTGDRAAKNREEARAAVLSIFKGQGEHPETVGNSPGTVWALYSAATEYADWYRSNERREGRRLQRAVDDPDGFKGRAWEMAVNLAGV